MCSLCNGSTVHVRINSISRQSELYVNFIQGYLQLLSQNSYIRKGYLHRFKYACFLSSLYYVDYQNVMVFNSKCNVKSCQKETSLASNHCVICIRLRCVLTQKATCFGSKRSVMWMDLQSESWKIIK